MESALNSFLNAELRCYQHLVNALGGLSGLNGYAGKLPRKTVDDTANLNEWVFAITGEGGGNLNSMISPAERPKKSWSASANFEGRFLDRRLALLAVGALMDALPAGEETDLQLKGIQYFGPEQDAIPTISSEVFNLGDTGFEQDGWLVRWDLQVVFGVSNEAALG
jgi:hypothetical protein